MIVHPCPDAYRHRGDTRVLRLPQSELRVAGNGRPGECVAAIHGALRGKHSPTSTHRPQYLATRKHCIAVG